jgi:acyl-CoA thioesterase-1
VMRDGQVGLRSYGPWGESKAVQATTYADQGLARAASATGATLVSTYAAFKGSRGTADPTSLLAADGDHPNARGHAVIAAAFLRAARAG